MKSNRSGTGRTEIRPAERRSSDVRRFRAVAFLLVGAALPILRSGAMPAPLVAQDAFAPEEVGLAFRSTALERELTLSAPLVETNEPYIVVHLAENRVLLVDGTEVVWSAPAGTGTGFTLDTSGYYWEFDTPRGIRQVIRKEKDPLWMAPDWHWVEKGLSPPPADHPSRWMRGVMGKTAIYIGDGLAIHGTDRPELILRPDPEDRRVSHGCIRLTDEAARELFHLVDVGTPVVIF